MINKNMAASPADFDKIHLQWFGDEPDLETDESKPNEDEGGKDNANIEKRLSKVEELLTRTTRILEEEKKASAGKDQKITELLGEKKKLQEATLSKDKLLEIREKEQEEREAEWAAKNTTERLELEQLRIEMERRKIVDKLENFPQFLAERLRGTTADEIEADAKELMRRWVKERDKVGNARKVTGQPKSGSGKQTAMNAEDVKNMTPKEKMQWAENATDEEFNAVFDELHTSE